MSRTGPLGRAATYKDLCAVPDHLIGEILDGDLWVSPRPAPRHSHVAAMLTAELIPPFQHGRGGPGGWHFLFEPELHLGGDVLVPDLAGWRSDRRLNLMERAHITHAPDWACGILSKATEQTDRGLKQGIYGRQGVRYLWYIDPTARKLEALRLAAGTWLSIVTLKGDASAAVEPFETLQIPLTRIWPAK